ncbi:signal transducer and activator of transcription 5B [Caerostris extrusa]|uniref:Signal transducer and activator of transcription 5B n=1 Tax=Caerostris extrusa TaxID=172846 RepID=A0AAV4T9J3_CAEEX|nr:signal transducer and activator of transcription 5B [Caerostris extrusa]
MDIYSETQLVNKHWHTFTNTLTSYPGNFKPLPPESNANGYVKPVLVTHLPGMTNQYGYDSYPNTPQSTLQSPDPGYHDSHSSDMQDGVQFPEVDYDILNMEFAPEVDEPVDFSSINVCDLVSYTHSS